MYGVYDGVDMAMVTVAVAPDYNLMFTKPERLDDMMHGCKLLIETWAFMGVPTQDEMIIGLLHAAAEFGCQLHLGPASRQSELVRFRSSTRLALLQT